MHSVTPKVAEYIYETVFADTCSWRFGTPNIRSWLRIVQRQISCVCTYVSHFKCVCRKIKLTLREILCRYRNLHCLFNADRTMQKLQIARQVAVQCPTLFIYVQLLYSLLIGSLMDKWSLLCVLNIKISISKLSFCVSLQSFLYCFIIAQQSLTDGHHLT